jgi:hypothetical protein
MQYGWVARVLDGLGAPDCKWGSLSVCSRLQPPWRVAICALLVGHASACPRGEKSFQPAPAGLDSSWATRKSRMKGGCRQDCRPHKPISSYFPRTVKHPVGDLRRTGKPPQERRGEVSLKILPPVFVLISRYTGANENFVPVALDRAARHRKRGRPRAGS